MTFERRQPKPIIASKCARRWRMFSQLCRARPRTLWNKFGGRQQPATEVNETPWSRDPEFNGEDRCQLEHCTFCDYRVCCQVSPSSPPCDWETETGTPRTEEDGKVTENPAYGLSSKNWLEERDDDGDVNGMDSPERIDKISTSDVVPHASQSQDCDAASAEVMNQVNFQSQFQQNRMELRTKIQEESSESTKHEVHGKLTWSVLRHRQLSGDVLKNCDSKSGQVIEHPTHDRNVQADSQDPGFVLKAKKNGKDRSFPLSLMRPIARMGDKKPDSLPQQHFNPVSRQRPVQRNARDKFQNPSVNKDADSSKRQTNDILGLNDPLSDIAQIKTEESIQEWLARIGESANNAWPEEEKEVKQEPPWSLLVNNTDEEKDSNSKLRFYRSDSEDLLPSPPTETPREALRYEDLMPKRGEVDAASVLRGASKASPANVPMVVMQCSRLHSHIGCQPPFQQTSLPMGTLVTALYQESDWLYVQTPHGVEGFVSSANCAPIGSVNEPAPASRRPWEPCDFPIQVSLRKRHEFGARQQGSSYIPARLPAAAERQAATPYVSTVRMKTSFYSDRYLSHTFKSKDSIKTAKTVTDILRSSPETKVSHQ